MQDLQSYILEISLKHSHLVVAVWQSGSLAVWQLEVVAEVWFQPPLSSEAVPRRSETKHKLKVNTFYAFPIRDKQNRVYMSGFTRGPCRMTCL